MPALAKNTVYFDPIIRASETFRFKNKELKTADQDETAYLLASPANRAHLLKAVDNIAHNRNLVTINLDELK
jgi:hypothetical protein